MKFHIDHDNSFTPDTYIRLLPFHGKVITRGRLLLLLEEADGPVTFILDPEDKNVVHVNHPYEY